MLKMLRQSGELPVESVSRRQRVNAESSSEG